MKPATKFFLSFAFTSVLLCAASGGNPAFACENGQKIPSAKLLPDGGEPPSGDGWGFPQSIEGINSHNPDCRPSLTADEKKIFFQSYNLNGKGWPGHVDQWDIYMAEWNGASWNPPVNLGPNVNTRYTDQRPCTSPDGTTLYFSSDRPGGQGGLDIYVTRWDGSNWSPAVNVGPAINTPASETEPFVTGDGKTMYLASNRPGGRGSSDIYISSWDGKAWSAPVNLGPPVNTSDPESHPFLTADGQKLYFCDWSGVERRGYGFLDIWVAKRKSDGWDTPKNIGAPINSDLPACSPFVTADGERLYYGSEAHEGSKGDEDLWMAEMPSAEAAAAAALWKRTGPLDGATLVHALAQSPAGELYAATAPNGDVFRSDDAGQTWNNTAELPGAVRVHCLLAAGDGALYAGTYPKGDVFKTTDGGKSWVNTAELPDITAVRVLTQTKGGVILAGTAPNFGSATRLYKTSDGGESWVLAASIESINSGIYSLLEAKDGALYAGGWSTKDRVCKSTDGGSTWTDAGNLFAKAEEICTINSLIEASDGSIFAGGWIHAFGAYIFKTPNGGANWTETGRLMIDDVHAVRVYALAQLDDGSLIAGLQPGVGGGTKVFSSPDSGETWRPAAALRGAGEILCFLKAKDGTLYAGTSPNGDVYKCATPLKLNRQDAKVAARSQD